MYESKGKRIKERRMNDGKIKGMKKETQKARRNNTTKREKEWMSEIINERANEWNEWKRIKGTEKKIKNKYMNEANNERKNKWMKKK